MSTSSISIDKTGCLGVSAVLITIAAIYFGFKETTKNILPSAGEREHPPTSPILPPSTESPTQAKMDNCVGIIPGEDKFERIKRIRELGPDPERLDDVNLVAFDIRGEKLSHYEAETVEKITNELETLGVALLCEESPH